MTVWAASLHSATLVPAGGTQRLASTSSSSSSRICHLGVVGAFVLCSIHFDQRSAASAGLKLRDELEHLQARGLRLVGRERYVRQRQ